MPTVRWKNKFTKPMVDFITKNNIADDTGSISAVTIQRTSGEVTLISANIDVITSYSSIFMHENIARDVHSGLE